MVHRQGVTTGPDYVQAGDLMVGCFKHFGRFFDAQLSLHGLSLSRAKVLIQLSSDQPVNQAALASTFGLAARTVTELVDSLERDGLVERITDPADRRARHVRLTESGERARDVAIAVRRRLSDRVLSVLNRQQLADLTSALRLIDAEIVKIEAEGTVGGVADIPTAS